MLVVRERLSPEVGAVVRRALEAAADQLYRNAGDTAEAPNPGREQDTAAGGAATGVEQDSTACASAGQRRADALRLVAEAALAADLDGGTAGDRYQVVVHVDPQALSAPPAGADVSCTDPAGLAARGESPASHRDRRCALLARREEGEYRQYATDEQRSQGGCSAGRMQPDFHHGLLAPASRSGARDQQNGAPVSQGSAGGQAVLEDGVYVPAETARRMACDAARVVMRHDRDGTVLDVGRKRRTIPPAIRRALAAGTTGAASPDATAGTAMHTTCATAWTAARRRSRISCFCVLATTGLSTRRDSPSSCGMTAPRSSSGPTAGHCPRPRRCRAGLVRRSIPQGSAPDHALPGSNTA